MPRDNIHHLHRAKPRLVRQLNEREREYLAKEVADIRAHVERDRFAKGFKHRHYRIGEPSRGEIITGRIAIALVGLTTGYFAAHFAGLLS